nr:unnamed protein product [Digitaria exilis]
MEPPLPSPPPPQPPPLPPPQPPSPSKYQPRLLRRPSHSQSPASSQSWADFFQDTPLPPPRHGRLTATDDEFVPETPEPSPPATNLHSSPADLPPAVPATYAEAVKRGVNAPSQHQPRPQSSTYRGCTEKRSSNFERTPRAQRPESKKDPLPYGEPGVRAEPPLRQL